MKGFPGGFGGGNMNNLLKQAQKLQKNMEETKKQLEEMNFESTSGGGVVSVKMNGKKEIVSIKLKPEIVDPDDIEMLQDLIISCINDTYKKVEEETNKEMSKLTGGFNIPGF
ncbi:YbaB/EbfC family nucleoid-associated protein [Candidatus Arthromitus sp. SFB-rat-Yit]|uniref:YbaB/EbfC family nucleoid-associated protein n=1 Tax=Candidatus Arthromitus sp. SFB-rat-Yit TaxID=1041504 RepID=UPI000227A636|nr:YbaB/EbfC family nucleoid-associated protein [Candidatus Arthromitus sp. SFB-rat-Yit]BAK80596.1 transcriptional regulatory protein [Candidatus Arthromitus sp. SFB-rat-Yit]